MLWEAGQEREMREWRQGMAARFAAARDAALEVLVSTGQAKATGRWKLPSYVTADQPTFTGSPEARDNALARLALMLPGAVRRDDA